MDSVQLILSYCGPAPLPQDVLWRWNFDPVLLAVLAAAVAGVLIAHQRGLAVLRNRIAFILGVAALAVAFISPLCAMASALFTARTGHHMLLVSIAAPLLAMALRQRALSNGWGAVFALLHALVFWFWHAPSAYEAALTSSVTYWLMQISLLASAFLLWRAILDATPLAGIGLTLASMMQMGLLGALLTFGRQAIYAPHFGSTAPWGLSPLQDQQLAGALMWVLGGIVLFGATLWHGHRVVEPRRQAAC